MPDATNTVTVDGVEPSISVRLLDISENPERIKLTTGDDGTERFLVKNSENSFLVTPADLVVLGSAGIEICDEKDIPISDLPAQNRPEVVISPPVNPLNTPGQTGQ